MKVVISGKTELGNTFELTVKNNKIIFSRQKDSLGNIVNDNLHKGNSAEFHKGQFIVRKGNKVVAETFGEAEITEIRISKA